MNIGFWTCIVLSPCFLIMGVLFAIIAYFVWGILFFKDVHLDSHKAFDKYLINSD